MKKIENMYKSDSGMYVITHNPELLDEDLIKALYSHFGNPADCSGISIPEIIQKALEFKSLKKGYYIDLQENGTYLTSPREFNKIDIYKNVINGRTFGCHLDIWNLEQNIVSRNTIYSPDERYRFVSENYEEAVVEVKRFTEEGAARKFMERIGKNSIEEFYRSSAAFLYNACIDLINNGGSFSKYTIDGELSIENLHIKLRGLAITKEDFKERFKNLKKEGILVMFK